MLLTDTRPPPGIANGCFFNLGARLARYTGNTTFSDWAIKTWDWMEKVGFINADSYAIYDGANINADCKDINKAQFSYNNGVFAQGAAFMYNYVGPHSPPKCVPLGVLTAARQSNGEQKWRDRTEKLVQRGLKTFFPNSIAVEPSCENINTCTTDMLTFKGFVHRWYSVITQVAPFTADMITPVLKKSTEAAIKQCTGGALGRQCGFKWASGSYDGKTGAGQEMAVLSAVQSQLIGRAKAPVTHSSGGTSQGNPDAGSGSDDLQKHGRPITAGDKAGASILTLLVLGGACGMFGWMSLGA